MRLLNNMTNGVMRQADLISEPRSTVFSLGFGKGLSTCSLSICFSTCVETVAIMPMIKQIRKQQISNRWNFI